MSFSRILFFSLALCFSSPVFTVDAKEASKHNGQGVFDDIMDESSIFLSGGVSTQGIVAEVGVTIYDAVSLVASTNWLGYDRPIVIDLSFIDKISPSAFILDGIINQIDSVDKNMEDLKNQLNNVSKKLENAQSTLTSTLEKIQEINKAIEDYNALNSGSQIALISESDLSVDAYKVAFDEITVFLQSRSDQIAFISDILQKDLHFNPHLIIEALSAGAFVELSSGIFGDTTIFNGFFVKGGFFWTESRTRIEFSVSKNLLSAINDIHVLSGSSVKPLIDDNDLIITARVLYDGGQEIFPYVGLGYRTRSRGFGFVFDAGVTMGFSPRIVVYGANNHSIPAIVEEVIPEIQAHLSPLLEFFPYVRFGIQYRF